MSDAGFEKVGARHSVVKHYNAVHDTNKKAGMAAKQPFLVALGETVRMLRARRGMTRRALAAEADVSERHLANLESGVGNASILVLRQVADALGCSLTDLFEPPGSSSPDSTLIRDLLRNRSDDDLQRARVALSRVFADEASVTSRRHRIALIGLRGAGKSTLGNLLARERGWPFVELTREIERLAGMSVAEIHSLYGASAYRRYERRALDDVVLKMREAVIATPGGLVSDAATFNRLLDRCYTVWVQATPEEHMSRVLAQGDYRPMSGNVEAMDDLRRILAGRAPFYAKADLTLDTSGLDAAQSFGRLRRALADAHAVPAVMAE